MELQKIDPKEFGLEIEQVQEIDTSFTPMIVERNGYIPFYEEIIKAEITPELCKKAGELRKKLVKVRTGIGAIHKTQKAFFLNAGRYVDSWKNKETLPVTQMEENLSAIEEYYERIEAKRILDIQKLRALELQPFEMDYIPDNLGKMKDSDWLLYKKGVEVAHNEKKQQEVDRIQKEKEEAADRDRLRAENERLRKLEEERIRKEKEDEKREKEQRQAELKKGDTEKVNDLISGLEDLKMRFVFQSEKNITMFENVRGLLDKVIDYVEKNTK